MTERKWYCSSLVIGDELSVEITSGGCILWSSSFRTVFGMPVFALAKCSTSVNWAVIPGFSGKFWERYPEDSHEKGIYVYILFNNSVAELKRVLRFVEQMGLLMEMQSGPAVIDFPILGSQDYETSVSGRHYISQLFERDNILPREPLLLRLYTAAVRQASLLPAGLLKLIPWYSERITKAKDIYARILG